MIKHIFTFAVIGFMAGTLLTGCGKTSEQKVDSGKEKVGEAKQELKDARAEYLAEWQTFKRESELTIEANEKSIDAFKEKMEKAGPKLKAKYGKEVAVLEQKNRDLKKKLEQYKDEEQSRWEEFKTNFKNDMDAIGKTMKDLFKDND
jgi:predicted PolB exonuclease-like 3'-5' exonuclease